MSKILYELPEDTLMKTRIATRLRVLKDYAIQADSATIADKIQEEIDWIDKLPIHADNE